MARHGSASPNGASVPNPTGMPAAISEAQRPQVRAVVLVDVGEVVVAALGHEPGLGHDREPERGDVGGHLVGHDGAVLDAVARPDAGVVPGGEGERQRRPRHAVHGDAPAPIVGGAHRADHVVEGREMVVGQHDLRRTDRDPVDEVERRRWTSSPRR